MVNSSPYSDHLTSSLEVWEQGKLLATQKEILFIRQEFI